MNFNTPLQSATLLKRFKRFLADVQLEDGKTLTIYCPNTGSMKSCSQPGSKVYFSDSGNSKRKYPHTLEIVRSGNCLVGVNTGLTNFLVEEAILEKRIAELGNVVSVTREITVKKGTRLDFLVETDRGKVYVEVKNCTLVENSVAQFPDAVTARGTKHLLELEELVSQGHRGVILFLVQRNDATEFAPAGHIDAEYRKTLKKVVETGVEPLVYQAEVSPERIYVKKRLPIKL